MEVPQPFQRSWSVYGPRNSENDYFQSQKNLQRSMSTRQPKMNIEKLFSDSSYNGERCRNDTQQIPWRPLEKNSPFKSKSGMKFRSTTDSNLYKFDRSGLSKGYQNLNSPKNSFYRRPLQQIPDRIAPLWNNIQNSVVQAKPKTEKLFQKGGEKFSRAIQGVRTSINTFSQRFKRTTRRHYKLDNTPTRTPGRSPSHSVHKPITPGKLYSPFDVNTPRTPHSYMKGPKRLQYGPHAIRNIYGKENMALLRTPPYHHSHSQHHRRPNWEQFDSPHHHHHQENSFYRKDPIFAPSSVHQYENFWQ